MKSIRTAMQVLSLMSPERPTLTVSSVARELDLSVSSASRILKALRSTGLLEQDESRRYRVGPMAFRLGSLYRSQNRLADLVTRKARQLAEQTGFACWISVLSGSDALLISRIPGTETEKFLVDPGSLLPGHASAGGKALLSRLSDAQVRSLFPGGTLDPRTPNTMSTVDQLLADLERVRRRGWSITDEELFIGVISVGTAVGAPDEPTMMSLSMSFPNSRRSQQGVDDIVSILVDATSEIGRSVGDPYWAAGPDTTARRSETVKNQ